MRKHLMASRNTEAFCASAQGDFPLIPRMGASLGLRNHTYSLTPAGVKYYSFILHLETPITREVWLNVSLS